MSEQATSEVLDQELLAIRAVLRTDVGLVRSENQDFGACTTPLEERRSRPGGRLLIVADGMGGHRGGATASKLATETVKSKFLGSDAPDIGSALRESLLSANNRIFSEAQSNPELRGMGTTTSVLAVHQGKGWIGHVGDSRIYLIREGGIRQLTDDHSLVATMMREGLLTPEEAESHPRRNVLQRSMGVAEDVEIDVLGPIDLQVGDMFILCSDGLHGLVKEKELNELSGGDLEAVADELLQRALSRGAPDNVTLIVARVERRDPASEETLDETHPVSAAEVSQFDDTVRESKDEPPSASAPPLRSSPPPSLDPDATKPVKPVPERESSTAAAAAANAVTAPMTAVSDAAAGATAVAPPEPTSPAAVTANPFEKTASSAVPASAPAAKETPVAPAVKTAGDAEPAAPAPASRTSSADTPGDDAGPKQEAKGSGSLVRWMVVLVLALGAAGAWFYWAQ
ncbi:MAG TPA: Stp1/IreP family PP2C-type Ser/Thr phosphatase [Thermoanaerobaculia bacterium]